MSRRKNKKQNLLKEISIIIVIICAIVLGYLNKNLINSTETKTENIIETESISFDLSTIPEYVNEPYVKINNNIPYFTEKDYTKETFENYSELDVLGRSGVAFANICKEIMPKEGEERGEIGNIKDLTRMGTKKI